jgi:hypothetical protein
MTEPQISDSATSESATSESATSESATSESAAPTANIELFAPLGGDQLSPGGSDALGFTAGNTGGARSAATPLHFTLPAGVDLERVTVDGAVVCTTVEECTLSPLEAGGAMNVTVIVRAAPGAQSGAVRIAVDRSALGWRLVVQSSATAIIEEPAPTGESGEPPFTADIPGDR